jgi:hypothetical protein
MDDLSQSLLTVLECPVCRQYMLPPITYCERGHNICSSCRLLTNRCPTCLKPFLDIQDTSLENLAKKSVFPCSKRSYGCTAFLGADFIMEHKNICLYRTHTSCPLVVIPKVSCNWKGHSSDLRNHIQMDHNVLIRAVRNKFKLLVPCEGKRNFNYQVISTMNELFFYVWENRIQRLHLSVFYIGPENIAYKFKYRFAVCKINTYLHHSWVARVLELHQWNERFLEGNSVFLRTRTFHLITKKYSRPFAVKLYKRV